MCAMVSEGRRAKLEEVSIPLNLFNSTEIVCQRTSWEKTIPHFDGWIGN